MPHKRILVAGLLLGAVLRALVLTSEGTPDVPSWKSWAAAAQQDPLGIYGVGGSPPERRMLRWESIASTTEYPPLGLYQLAAVGRVYRTIDPALRGSPLFTVLIKVPGLIAEVLFIVLVMTMGRRVLGDRAATWLTLAVWLNPAIILNGAALGYLDAQMAMPVAGAFLAIMAGWPLLAGVLAAAALLTKLQAMFVGLALVVALARQHHMPARLAMMRFLGGGAATAAAVLVPIAVHGAWANMLQAVSRAASQDMVSGYATNVWWLVTWLVRASHGAPVLGWTSALTSPVKVLSISRFVEVGYPDPKLLGAVVVMACSAWGTWRFRRASAPADWVHLAGWSVLSYFVWNLQVHENHLYVAVPLFALAAALDPRHRLSFWCVSAACTLNMYVFYGLGKGRPPLVDVNVTGVDVSVLLSVAVIALWIRLAGLKATPYIRKDLRTSGPQDLRTQLDQAAAVVPAPRPGERRAVSPANV